MASHRAQSAMVLATPIIIPIGLIAFVGYRLLRPRRKRVTMEATITAAPVLWERARIPRRFQLWCAEQSIIRLSMSEDNKPADAIPAEIRAAMARLGARKVRELDAMMRALAETLAPLAKRVRELEAQETLRYAGV